MELDSQYKEGNGRWRFRAYSWVLSACLSIASSWHLLVWKNYSHPLHLHALHIQCALIVSFLHALLSGKTVQGVQSPYFVLPVARGGVSTNPTQLAFLVLSSLCMAWSMPLFLKAVVYSPSVPALIFISTISFLPDALGNAYQESRFSYRVLSRALGVISTVLLIVFDDYRGSSKSLVHGTHCFVLVGLSKLFCSQAIAAEKEFGATRANERYWIAIRNTSIPISLIITLIWGATRKDWATGLWDVSAVNPFLLGFNMITSTAAISTGGSLVVFSFAGDSGDQQDRFQPAPLLCSLAVGLISTLVPYPVVVTPLQLTAFITAIACLAWPDISSEVSSLKNQDDAELKGLEQGWRTNLTALTLNRVVAAARYFALLCLGILCLSSAWQSTTRTAPTSPETVEGLDCAYQPPSEMDFVVSMYREPLSVVSSTIAALRDIPSIAALSPRAHIYVKDADADVEAIRNATGAHAVTVLPNVGREGHTYLHHTLARWDRLARHTLFIQAEPHDFANALRRIREYYVPTATGMLSLGNPGISCDCGGDSTSTSTSTSTCGDPHWRDTSNAIGSVYQRVHNRTRAACSRALLSYRGQFVASAARLRAVDRALYGELAATLASPASWALREEFRFDGRENTPQAPQFGYTVERLWAVLLRCADPAAATRCPALHAGRPRWGSDADCQCLDDGACSAAAARADQAEAEAEAEA